MTSTTGAAALPGLDAPAVERWLVDAGLGLRAPLGFTLVGRGRSNLTFELADHTGRKAILRRPPLGDLLESAHDMAREHRVLSVLAGTPVPVPRPLAFCSDPAVTGAPFYVMERVPGEVVDSVAAAERLGREGRARLGPSLAEALAAIHAVDPDAVGLGDFGSRSPFAARQLRRWTGQWEASRTAELPALDRVTEQLHRSMPEAGEIRLVHGDYGPTNVLTGAGGEVTGVLDWELCTLGDPLADVGILAALWADAEHDGPPDRLAITRMDGFCSRAELIDAYARASGRGVSAVPFYVALAYWRLAIIVQGVYRRWLDDPANGGTGAGEMGAHVERLVELAARAADEAGL